MIFRTATSFDKIDYRIFSDYSCAHHNSITYKNNLMELNSIVYEVKTRLVAPLTWIGRNIIISISLHFFGLFLHAP